MPSDLRVPIAVCVLAWLVAASAARADPDSESAVARSPVRVALGAAAGATTSHVAASVGDLPGRTRLASHRALAAAGEAAAAVLPEDVRARARSARDAARSSTAIFSATLRIVSGIHGHVTRAGGFRPAADRILDLAALAAAAGFAIAIARRAWRGRSARSTTGRTRWAATD